ncbi:hypothetical protein [Aquipuribacter sp. MA13-6]|uniref:hypothetical protein n=1 Tax=unclassified Aquipuribacter TaxID=2635084 RepID=UPI003EEBB763
MPTTDTQAEPAPARRRVRLLPVLMAVLAVLTGAWFALRRRAPALPAFPAEARPGPGTTARPPTPAPASGRVDVAAAPPVEPAPVEPAPVEPAPVEPVPAEPVPAGSPTAVAEPVQPSAAASAASEELQRVSGIGRRSAEALVAAGIDGLDRLAATDDATLVVALEAAGLRRSPTLSAWASQARRLTQE